MKEKARILTDAPADGPTNMGRDQTLLDRVGRGAASPTLRFYRWSPATISLGYFQHYADYEALPPPLGKLPVVRRVTGGGAIVHAAELTYSLTLPRTHRLAAGNPACLYDTVHAAIIAAASEVRVTARRRGPCGSASEGLRRGPFLCFSRRHATDVLVGEAKLAGSAQRRTREGVLQHGSIILQRPFDQQASATLGPDTDVGRLICDITQQLAQAWDVAFTREDWLEAERTEAAEQAERFRDPAWTRRR